MKEKRALCLPGGGAKGAFQIGVLLHLICELGEEYDIITGISVGALNGAFLAQYGKKNLKQGIKDLHLLWLEVDNAKIRKNWKPFGFLHYLWKKSLYNSTPLEELIDEKLSVEKLKNSDIELSVGTLSLDSGMYTEYNGHSPNIKDAVKASASFPIFFKKVKLDGEYHVDGGVKETAPLAKAIELGAVDVRVDVQVSVADAAARRSREAACST